MVTLSVPDRPVFLAVRNPKRIRDSDGVLQLFNAESAGYGRMIVWDTKADAQRRAAQIRKRGFQARVIGRQVYVGDVRKDRRGSPLTPRANYDWTGATAADTRLD